MNRSSNRRRVGLVLALCLALGACAAGGAHKSDGAAQPSSGGPGAAAATAPAASVPAAAKAATATTATAAATQSPPKPPPGFKARKRDGQLVYCRTVQSTGSHFPEEQCWPPEKVQAALDRQREASQKLLEQQRGCRGTECVGGS